MSEELLDLPILDELGAALLDGFRRREARRRRRRPALRAAALVAAAAIGAVVVLATQLGDGRLGAADASAAQVLQSAARAAAAQPVRLAGRGRYFYVRFRSSVLVPVGRHPTATIPTHASFDRQAVVTIETGESWSTTRAGEIESRLVSVRFPTPAARSRWLALGRPALYRAVISRREPAQVPPLGGVIPVAGRAPLTARALLHLPPNASALYARLFARSSAPVAIWFMQNLELYMISPRLQGGLYRALARVHGIVAVGAVRILDGRTGVALGARAPGGFEEEIVLDPHTGALLGDRAIVISRRATGLPVGTIRNQTVVIERGIAARAQPVPKP
jgi:hypothetical protein